MLLSVLTPGKMADSISNKVSYGGSAARLPLEVSKPKATNLSKCFESRLPRHSTPKKLQVAAFQELDSTQFLPLDVNNGHFATSEKNCLKCLLFKGGDPTQALILQLEQVKLYLERDARQLTKTRKCVKKMCESNENMRVGLSQHQEDINEMNLRLSTVTTNLASFIEKEEAFFAKFLQKR